MQENILEINLTESVKRAFYSLPDMTDENGNSVGGEYGALFAITEKLKSSENNRLRLVSSAEDIQLTKTVSAQAQDLQKRLLDIMGADTCDITEELKASFEQVLYGLSPSGEVKSAPKFTCAIRETDDLSEVEKLFKDALEYGKKSPQNYISFYFLTDNTPGRDILGMALSFDANESVYIPVRNFITCDYLGKKLEELSEFTSLVTFDIKNSYRVFTPREIKNRTEGYSAVYDEEKNRIGSTDLSYTKESRCVDILIGAYLLNPIKNDYEPGDVAKEYLKLPLEKKNDIFGKKPFADADEKLMCDFAAKVSNVCLLAAPVIRKKLETLGMEDLFYNIEMPLSYILYAMEKEGIIAKPDELKAYGDKLSIRIKELEKDIYEAAGEEFNINSPKQLGDILFEKLHLPAEKKTKSGYSTAADVLEKLAPYHKIVSDILEYRGLAKLKSTYADGLAEYIEEDGRIHTSFNQTITATGRISSTEPNLQNIPMRTELGRLIRKVFVPKQDYVFADADYSQIELRILAHMSRDEGLIEAYHKGYDIHRSTASRVFHVPFDEVTDLQRRNAKAVNFGIVYGISAFGLSQDLSISVGEAKDYMEKYFETYPGVKIYQERSIREAKETGFSTTLFGRKRPIPELKNSNFNLRQFGERVAMNAPIQGTAADIMKIAMINVFFRLKKENLLSRVILQIHDELVIETAPSEEAQVKDILAREMEKAVALSVPLEVDCHTGSDWYEAK